MQYKRLKSMLNRMSLDNLEKDITIEFDDELFNCLGFRVADADLEDRVDDGTLILVALTDDGQLKSEVITRPLEGGIDVD